MKKILYITIVLTAIFLAGCNRDTDKNVENSTEIDIEVLEEVTRIDHIDMQYDEGPSGRFLLMPHYYQQDYADIEIGGLNIAEKGNLATALAMIYSYEKSEYITPDVFTEKFDINVDGSNKIEVMEAMAREIYHIQDEEFSIKAQPFDAEKMAYYLHQIRTYVLVRIPHPSMYGNLSTYLIVTGTTESGDLIVRDSNRENIEKYASFGKYNEPVYPSFDFCVAAGEQSEMYILNNYEKYDTGVEYE